MHKFFLAFVLLAASTAIAAPLADKDKAALAGEWRPDCATSAGPRFTLEFAVTGGQIFIAAPGIGRIIMGVHSTDAATGADGDTLSLAFQTRSAWTFQRKDAGTLVSQTPPDGFGALKDVTFHRCRPPADRAQLKLAHDAIDFFSVMMPPDYPTFIDAHEKLGCKASAYSYVSIDLVGPEEFALTRGTLRPRAKGQVPQLDSVTTWAIDAAEELPNVVRLTVTELAGPGHARGATTKISLVAGEGAELLTIPEWDAVYRRCSIGQLAPG